MFRRDHQGRDRVSLWRVEVRDQAGGKSLAQWAENGENSWRTENSCHLFTYCIKNCSIVKLFNKVLIINFANIEEISNREMLKYKFFLSITHLLCGKFILSINWIVHKISRLGLVLIGINLVEFFTTKFIRFWNYSDFWRGGDFFADQIRAPSAVFSWF